MKLDVYFHLAQYKKFPSCLTFYGYIAVYLELQDKLEAHTVTMFQLWVP